jgi:hypothetical protein
MWNTYREGLALIGFATANDNNIAVAAVIAALKKAK